VVPAVVQGQEIKVTLLGTGCPPPVMHRFGPSTLVEAGEQKLPHSTELRGRVSQLLIESRPR